MLYAVILVVASLRCEVRNGSDMEKWCKDGFIYLLFLLKLRVFGHIVHTFEHIYLLGHIQEYFAIDGINLPKCCNLVLGHEGESETVHERLGLSTNWATQIAGISL